MKRAELVAYLDTYLRIGEIRDYGPQGLQIEGRAQVKRCPAPQRAPIRVRGQIT